MVVGACRWIPAEAAAAGGRPADSAPRRRRSRRGADLFALVNLAAADLDHDVDARCRVAHFGGGGRRRLHHHQGRAAGLAHPGVVRLQGVHRPRRPRGQARWPDGAARPLRGVPLRSRHRTLPGGDRVHETHQRSVNDTKAKIMTLCHFFSF